MPLLGIWWAKCPMGTLFLGWCPPAFWRIEPNASARSSTSYIDTLIKMSRSWQNCRGWQCSSRQMIMKEVDTQHWEQSKHPGLNLGYCWRLIRTAWMVRSQFLMDKDLEMWIPQIYEEHVFFPDGGPNKLAVSILNLGKSLSGDKSMMSLHQPNAFSTRNNLLSISSCSRRSLLHLLTASCPLILEVLGPSRTTSCRMGTLQVPEFQVGDGERKCTSGSEASHYALQYRWSTPPTHSRSCWAWWHLYKRLLDVWHRWCWGV